MRTYLRSVGTALGLAFGLLALGPLGGPVAAVSTFGDSMLPTHAAHDLVVVHRAGEHAVGDVIAFRSPTLGAVVLHRIVAVEDGRYVTQGDNNDWLDPDAVAPQDVIGRAWASVPQLGRLLELPHAVLLLLPLGGVLVVLARRRGRHGHQGPRAPRAAEANGRTSPAVWAGIPGRVGVGGVVALAAGGVLAATSWGQPSSVASDVEYEQTGRFSYQATVPVSAVYPDGVVDAGEPIFLRVADRVAVSFEGRLDGPEAADLRGSGQLVAMVADGTGWTGRVPLGPAREWTGPAADLTGELDFRSIRRLGEDVAAATGVGGTSWTVALTAEIVVEGQVAGQSFTSETAPTMTFKVDELRAVPSGSVEESDVLRTTDLGTVTAPASQVAKVAVGPLTLRVPTARAISLVLLVAGSLLAALAASLALRSKSWDPSRRIRARFGDDMVDTVDISEGARSTLVSLGTIEDLVAVARHRGLPVLRVALTEGREGYVVQDAGTRYRYDASVAPEVQPRRRVVVGTDASRPARVPSAPVAAPRARTGRSSTSPVAGPTRSSSIRRADRVS